MADNVLPFPSRAKPARVEAPYGLPVGDSVVVFQERALTIGDNVRILFGDPMDEDFTFLRLDDKKNRQALAFQKQPRLPEEFRNQL